MSLSTLFGGLEVRSIYESESHNGASSLPDDFVDNFWPISEFHCIILLYLYYFISNIFVHVKLQDFNIPM